MVKIISAIICRQYILVNVQGSYSFTRAFSENSLRYPFTFWKHKYYPDKITALFIVYKNKLLYPLTVWHIFSLDSLSNLLSYIAFQSRHILVWSSKWEQTLLIQHSPLFPQLKKKDLVSNILMRLSRKRICRSFLFSLVGSFKIRSTSKMKINMASGRNKQQLLLTSKRGAVNKRHVTFVDINCFGKWNPRKNNYAFSTDLLSLQPSFLRR